MLAMALLLLVLVLVCIIKRNRGGKYAVHEREATHGRKDFNEDAGFHEYSQPYGILLIFRTKFRIVIKIRNGSFCCPRAGWVAVARQARPLWAAEPKCHPRAKTMIRWPNTVKEKQVNDFDSILPRVIPFEAKHGTTLWFANCWRLSPLSLPDYHFVLSVCFYLFLKHCRSHEWGRLVYRPIRQEAWGWIICFRHSCLKFSEINIRKKTASSSNVAVCIVLLPGNMTFEDHSLAEFDLRHGSYFCVCLVGDWLLSLISLTCFFFTFSTGEFAESGSFIGQYGQSKLPTPLTTASVATIV